jgi:hypothetical protein
MGRPDGNIGRPDGARAIALSPFFSRGAFGGVRTGCERTSNGQRTELSVLVLEFLTASRPDGYESRPTLVLAWLFSFHFAHEH